MSTFLLVTILFSNIFDVDTREYSGFVEKCYDADTCTVTIDLGFNLVAWGQKLRLYGIDAPELRGATKEAGKVSRDWLLKQVRGKQVIVLIVQKTNRIGQKYDAKGKYGRYLAILKIGDRNINEELVDEGYAIEKVY